MALVRFAPRATHGNRCGKVVCCSIFAAIKTIANVVDWEILAVMKNKLKNVFG